MPLVDQIAKLKIKNSAKQQGFALIYTMLFIILLMLTVSTTWITGLADLRLSQNTQFSAEAYQLAQSGIEDGWIKYQNKAGTAEAAATVNFPDATCSNTTNAKYQRTWPDGAPPPVPAPSPTPMNLAQRPPIGESALGVYDYNVCTDGGAVTIKSIGYYKGTKITLKGTVEQSPRCDEYQIPGDNTSPCTKWDHESDKLTITQEGPSQ